MTSDLVAMLAGLILSLTFEYVPGAADWYGKFEPTQKRLIMLALLGVAALFLMGASCSGLYDVGVVCAKDGAAELLRAFLLAMVANGGAHSLLKKPALQ